MVWGKVLGGFFGFLLLRWPGIFLGVLIGHWFDRALEQNMRQGGGPATQQLFIETLFAVLGHLAKSKGRVTEQDIGYVSALMQHLKLSDDAKERAQEAFREGKNADYPLVTKVSAFRRQVAWRRDLLQFFVEQILVLALHDGKLEQAEYDVLLRITQALGFRREQLDLWLQMAQAGQRFRGGQGGGYQGGTSGVSAAQRLDDAYAVLGVSRQASFAEVKKAYRKLMAKHHPDKLAAQGLPPEMRESAQQKAQEIQAAYELIKSQQGNGS
ncbi:co-chaperone DjlA [Pseudidiomarina insulisalsae]|uniref:Co-chaperone protein DjlA n=1 Tax=Pseudidiomarina insulisalsae TaxID=575789 RepID=A0A432YA26_9GAMM|nr:co-chaperone DjlA [Pseudidiomarina insulisalsae]RUO57830.1 co-chaperone DjlA [Pseudidiomarina insulisalsae]